MKTFRRPPQRLAGCLFVLASLAFMPTEGLAQGPNAPPVETNEPAPEPSDSAAAAPTDSAADAPVPVPSFSLSGFIGATTFAQNQSFGFGNGQSALFAAERSEDVDPWFMGGDVRNTRLRLTAAAADGPSEWRAGGVLEVDFFGSFNGTGPFNDEQPQPRLRLAYVELARGGTTIQLGQNWSPIVGVVPVSVTHIAFPLGLGSGFLGWRFPGLSVEQRLLGSDRPVRMSVKVGVFRGSWVGTDGEDPGQVVDHRSAGEAGTPQLEGRLDVASRVFGAEWSAYLVGHVDEKDLSGIGDEYDVDDTLRGSAVEVGGRIERDRVTLLGNGYAGRAIGQQFGALAQFGDIASQGGWGQAGYDLAPRLSVWYFRGFDDPDDADVRANAGTRLRNDTQALSLQWDDGVWKAAVEWFEAETRWIDGARHVDRSAHQFSFSVLYTF